MELNQKIKLLLPLGVASTLRRVGRDAMHCVSTMLHRAESPVINSTGQRPVGKERLPINKPQRGVIESNNRISPFQGYGDRSPLSTGRCPVLLMTGLSALNLTDMGQSPARAILY
jgi:hypothetical protein